MSSQSVSNTPSLQSSQSGILRSDSRVSMDANISLAKLYNLRSLQTNLTPSDDITELKRQGSIFKTQASIIAQSAVAALPGNANMMKNVFGDVTQDLDNINNIVSTLQESEDISVARTLLQQVHNILQQLLAKTTNFSEYNEDQAAQLTGLLIQGTNKARIAEELKLANAATLLHVLDRLKTHYKNRLRDEMENAEFLKNVLETMHHRYNTLLKEHAKLHEEYNNTDLQRHLAYQHIADLEQLSASLQQQSAHQQQELENQVVQLTQHQQQLEQQLKDSSAEIEKQIEEITTTQQKRDKAVEHVKRLSKQKVAIEMQVRQSLTANSDPRLPVHHNTGKTYTPPKSNSKSFQDLCKDIEGQLAKAARLAKQLAPSSSNFKVTQGSIESTLTILKRLKQDICGKHVTLPFDIAEQTYREQEQALAEIDEDLNQTVRVYARLRKADLESSEDQSLITVKEGKLMFHSVCNNTTAYKNMGDAAVAKKHFYQVFGEQVTTEGVFDQVKNLFSALKRGWHIILFGYGASGAGKTYTLLGDPSVATNVDTGSWGLLQHTTKYLDTHNIKCELHAAFELYVDDTITTLDPSSLLNKLAGKIIILHDANNAMYEHLTKHTAGNMHISKELIKPGQQESTSALLSRINQVRQDQGRVLQESTLTFNNVSSRSHLFLVFKTSSKSTQTKSTDNYFTVVDMAGRESPAELVRSWLPGTRGVTQATNYNAITSMIQKTGEVKRQNIELIQKRKILKESFFINESLTHLIHHLKSRIQSEGAKTDLTNRQQEEKSYSTQRWYVDPRKEAQGKVDAQHNCGMIPALKALESLGARNRVKYVMMCALQQVPYSSTVTEQSKLMSQCERSLRTLQFASSISSVNP